MITYIGSKRALIPNILEVVKSLDVRSTLDLFSGTSRVGVALKQAGYSGSSNDIMHYAEILARCYIWDVSLEHKCWIEAQSCIEDLKVLKGTPGYFTETFCEKSRFFQPFNGERVDAIREKIAEWLHSPKVEAILLTSLMEAADRVDSTCGLQTAYLKKWASRSFNPLELRLPERTLRCPIPGHVTRLNAKDACLERVDLVYMDPPYNQHSYAGNYHIWESLIRWDKPEVYGVACKRIDTRTTKSDFNSKKTALAAMSEVVKNADCRYMLVSFNDEGYISKDAMETLLKEVGEVQTFPSDYKRYVGAQIRQHNLKGERVGSPTHTRNTEYLYLCTKA